MQTRVGPLFKRQSIMASVVALLVGGLVLLSWAFDIPVLGRLHSGLITMKANTAACFILSATALLLFCKEQGSKSARFLAYVFAVTAAGSGPRRGHIICSGAFAVAAVTAAGVISGPLRLAGRGPLRAPRPRWPAPVGAWRCRAGDGSSWAGRASR